MEIYVGCVALRIAQLVFIRAARVPRELQNGLLELTVFLRSEPPFTGVSGPEIEKCLKKGLLGGLQKSPRKYPKVSKNTQKGPKIVIFRPFRVFFVTFLQIPPQKTLFETFLRFRALRGPETPVNGGSDRNHVR